MSKVYEFEEQKWRDHQSGFTKFLDILKKYDLNCLNDVNKDYFLLKMLELNQFVDSIDVVLDEIKYECLYPNSDKKDHKKIKLEIQEHLQRKSLIKSVLFQSMDS